MVQKAYCCQTVRGSREAPSPERRLPWKTITLRNCERSLINYSSSKPKFWNHEALAQSLTPKSSNTKFGKKSFTTSAINSPTRLRPSGHHAATDAVIARLREPLSKRAGLRASQLRRGGNLFRGHRHFSERRAGVCGCGGEDCDGSNVACTLPQTGTIYAHSYGDGS